MQQLPGYRNRCSEEEAQHVGAVGDDYSCTYDYWIHLVEKQREITSNVEHLVLSAELYGVYKH